MKLIKIPVENTVGFVMGDISVDVDIRFRPVSVPNGVVEKVALESFNGRLGSLAWKIKQDVKEKVEKVLSES